MSRPPSEALAYTLDLDLDATYDELLRRARDSGHPITQVAHHAIAEVIDRRQ